MVLIIPTSGCIHVDLKNIARQMLNIEQNTKLFDNKLNPANCDCIAKDVSIKHKVLNNSASFSYVKSDERFNVYTLPNPLDSAHPIEVETISNVGTIAIYLDSHVIAEDLKKVIVKALSLECTRTAYELISRDEEIHTNGIICIDEPACTTSRYTLISQPIDLEAPREIHHCGVGKKARTYNSGMSECFIWNVYVIYAGSYSTYDLLKFLGFGYEDIGVTSINDTSVVSKRAVLDYSNLVCNHLKETANRQRRQDNESIKYIENYLLDKPDQSGNDLVTKMYAPNMILLDGADLFNTKCVVKQLEFPNMAQYNYPKFIDLLVPITGNYGYDQIIAQEYMGDYQLTPLLHTATTATYMAMRSSLKQAISELISPVSWYCGKALAQTISGTADSQPIAKRDRKKLANIKHVYFLQPNGVNGIDPTADIHENMQTNLSELIMQYGAKMDNSQFLNIPANRCYITGVPLWEYYFEFQFLCTIKINTKVTHDVLICMQISKLGMMYLSDSARNANDYLNHNRYGDLRFTAGNVVAFLKLLFDANKYKVSEYNLVMRKSELMRRNIINELKSPLVRKFLSTVDQFGSVYTHHNLYAVNPNTNEIFVGIHCDDFTDNFLMHMKKNSGAYILRIC